MRKSKINVIVMEDNRMYNQILSRALQEHLVRKKNQFGKARVRMYSFTDPDKCVETIRSDKFTGSSIAFLDYYLGKGTNGMHLLKIFKEKNNKIKFVVLSQSDQIVSKLMNSNQIDLYGHVIKKDAYTLDVCCILLEDFLERYSP